MFLIEPNSGISTILESTQSLTVNLPHKKVRRSGSIFNEVWEYVVKGKKANPGHYKAEYTSIETSINMNFNPEDLVDTILNIGLD
ncbi:26262_t:CDS:2 [Gigaspora margarita]|uniref:26262_t:CDS:1 n=1 Tax=Gigaspora margarita TaxID=4874 RepID=A0ABN7ULU1_GIGMA|nr:26262_t:CDS:2 [Gigaspora margarita]